MNTDRSLLDRVVESAKQLGALYGGWAALVALLGAAIAGVKALASFPRAGEMAFYVAVILGVLAVVSLPLLIQAMRQRSTQPMMMNPLMTVNGIDDDWAIGREDWTRNRKVTVTARKTVDRFRFEFRLTGSAICSVKLDTPGQLLGPARRHDGFEYYEVVFEKPLKEKDTTDIWLIFTVRDPDRTIHPYIAERFSNAPKFGSYRQQFRFEPAELSGTVYRDVRDGLTGQPLEPITPVLPSVSGVYSLEVKQVEYGRIYTTSWGSRNNG